MISSLYSGVQGLNVFTKALGVVGANIANVNTNGYKSGDLTFATILGETVAEGGVKVWGMRRSWAQGVPWSSPPAIPILPLSATVCLLLRTMLEKIFLPGPGLFLLIGMGYWKIRMVIRFRDMQWPPPPPRPLPA